MKIRAGNLSWAALDWAVAVAEGLHPQLACDKARYFAQVDLEVYSPTRNWAQGGPIIERMFAEGLRLHTTEFVTGVHDKSLIAASLDTPNGFRFGPTPLIAAMRCFVASKLGDEVEIPDELLT